MTKKKVCIIADPIDEQYAGIYTYAAGLISGLERIGADDIDITYLHLRENLFFEGKKELIVPLKRHIPGYATFRKFFYLPFLFRKHQFDIVHDLSHIAPFPFKKTKYKKIFTVHDLTPILFPEWHIKNSVIVHSILFPILFRTADAVVAVSEATKSDIMNTFPDAPPVTVTHLAGKELEPVLAEKEKIILFVSTIEPRKNVVTLVKAYEHLRSTYSEVTHKLVLVGKQGWKSEESMAVIMNSPWKNDIIWKEYIPDEELTKTYASASIFVYPSQYEGFGLPILEAMKYGLPVVGANNSSIAEVIGEYGLLCETTDYLDFSEKLYTLCTDDNIYELYHKKSLERATHFSWNDTAKQTLDLYRTL